MNLIPWKSRTQVQTGGRASPFDALESFRWEVDRMFDRWMRDPWSLGDEPFAAAQTVALPIDVTETDGEVLVRADVPGVEPKDLEITLTGDVLTLSGSKKEERQEGSEGHYVSERRFGAFRR
ncbi:MAG TPA: Hsp20/alpha crystallin family protein, partial [Planctomycetota bacterium]|nr:Hsp20/alpha crystallin family protein [Planctomycetota bacterium]